VRRSLLPLAGALITLAAAQRPARPCAAVAEAGRTIEIADETAIIVWDDAHKVEHFIRTASFSTSPGVDDFGFLVPTPTRPELGEVRLELYDRLEAAVTAERFVRKRAFRVGCGLPLPGMAREPRGALPRVRVLEKARIAGYEAAVLEADSATALAEWLEQSDYANRPDLAAWLAPYVAAGWKVSAFRFRPSEEGVFPTAAVLLSFAAERPFFPYREPADATPGSWRSLRVYLVGGGKMTGSLGERGERWPGQLEYAGPLLGLRRMLADVLPDGALPDRPWLMSFVDLSRSRLPGDLFFSPAADAAPFAIPIEVEEKCTIPVELLVPAAVIGLLVLRRRARRRRARRGGSTL
jgi:hypothetical protein